MLLKILERMVEVEPGGACLLEKLQNDVELTNGTVIKKVARCAEFILFILFILFSKNAFFTEYLQATASEKGVSLIDYLQLKALRNCNRKLILCPPQK